MFTFLPPPHRGLGGRSRSRLVPKLVPAPLSQTHGLGRLRLGRGGCSGLLAGLGLSLLAGGVEAHRRELLDRKSLGVIITIIKGIVFVITDVPLANT